MSNLTRSLYPKRYIPAVLLAIIGLPLTAHGAIAVDSATSKNSGANTSLTLPISGDTWTHTVSGSNTILIVGVAIRQAGTESVSSVTYNGSALTRIGTATRANAMQAELWYQLAPSGGTHNVVVTLNTAARFVAGAISFNGVDQNSPLGTFVGQGGNSKAVSVDVTSAADELVVDVMGYADSATSVTMGPGQTQQWADATTNGTTTNNSVGRSSTEAGATTVTMSWQLLSKENYAIGAVPLKPYFSGFDFRKSITIDRSKVGVSGTSTTALSNFPMLVSFTDASLRTVVNGGHVTSSNGYDIIFRGVDATTCGGAANNPCTLDYQVEKYDGTTGQLIAWVRLPSVNTIAASSDTTIYLYYGNESITSSLQNVTGVWDANYMGVWHLSDNAASTTAAESTSNANIGTAAANTSTKTTAGLINTALNFNGTNDYIYTTDSFSNPQNLTLSAWTKTSAASGNKVIGFEDQRTGTASTYYDRMLWIGTDGKAYAGCYSPTYGFRQVSSTNVLNDNNWHYLAGLINDSGNVLRLYVDGALNNSVTVGEGCQNYGRVGYFRIGSYKAATWTNGTDGYFPGSIDEARVSTAIRSADWIKAEYNNQSSPSTFYAVGAEQASPRTLIKLISFTAENYSGLVQLKWKTGYEVDNLGFRIYREDREGLTRITPSMIAGSALLAGGHVALSSGWTYTWQDVVEDSNRSCRYWLEDVDTKGKSTWHGPVSSVPGGYELPQQVRSAVLSYLGKGASKTRGKGSGWKVSGDGSADMELSERSARGMEGIAFAAGGARMMGTSSASTTVQMDLAGKPGVKILVRKEGWYRVGQPELAEAGLSVLANPKNLRMYAEGVEQAILVHTCTVTKAKCDQQFNEGDWIEFYGTGLDTPWTDTRVYWLVEGSQAGKRITTVNGASRKSGITSLWTTKELRPKTVYWAGLQNGDEENFFGSVVSAEGDPEVLDFDYLDTTATKDGQLEIGLQGVTDGMHSVWVEVNGSAIGSLAFNGQSAGTGKFAVSAGLLRMGGNDLRLTAQNGEEDISLVSYSRISYQRTLGTDEDALLLTVAGNQVVTVEGFSSAAIRVIDVTSPVAVKEVTGTVAAEGAGYAVTVSIAGTGTHKLMVFGGSRIEGAAGVKANNPSMWNREVSGADVIIIAHPDFVDSLGSLKAQQEAEGYTVALVDVEDVYDEFSYGEKTPYAVKDFVAKGKKDWKRKPAYLLLAGDASFDPKDYLGLGDFDFVPTKLVGTKLLETASDDWYGDSDEDGIPEIAVGRLSVRTAAEAAAEAAKIVAYRQSGGGDWAKNVVLVADSNDGFDFEGGSDKLIDEIPGSMVVLKIYRGQTDDATARAWILQRLNAGALLMNYLGHGSVELWRGDLLTSGDAAGLTNGARLPFVVAMDCLNGFFNDIYTESLAEALMKAPLGGAVAAWASSGLSEPEGQQTMNRELFNQLFNYSRTIGEAVMKAKASTDDPDVRKSWILFGDPTLKLRH